LGEDGNVLQRDDASRLQKAAPHAGIVMCLRRTLQPFSGNGYQGGTLDGKAGHLKRFLRTTSCIFFLRGCSGFVVGGERVGPDGHVPAGLATIG